MANALMVSSQCLCDSDRPASFASIKLHKNVAPSVNAFACPRVHCQQRESVRPSVLINAVYETAPSPICPSSPNMTLSVVVVVRTAVRDHAGVGGDSGRRRGIIGETNWPLDVSLQSRSCCCVLKAIASTRTTYIVYIVGYTPARSIPSSPLRGTHYKRDSSGDVTRPQPNCQGRLREGLARREREEERTLARRSCEETASERNGIAR